LKLVHISYLPIEGVTHPGDWFKRVGFFYGILDALATHIEVHNIAGIGYTGNTMHNGVHHHFLPAKKIRSTAAINHYIKSIQPDVVIVAGLMFPYQLLMLRRKLGKRVKIIVQHHAEQTISPYLVPFQWVAQHATDAFFFTSRDLAEPWIRRGLVPAKKVFEVMETASVFQRYTIDQQQRDDKRPLVYLWVGRLIEKKDPLTAVKGFAAFAKIYPQVQLYIIYSTDNMLMQVKEAIDRCNAGDCIHLVSKVPHSDMEQWYKRVDCIISTSFYEGSGVAVIEAISCGCIPVLSDIASFRTISGNGRYGVLFEKGNPAALADALVTTQGMDVDEKKAEVEKYYQSALSFTAIADEMLSVFRRL